MSALPEVVIVGRPNVGKSTLMNRILGRREAIVEERPGVTRDRKEVEADWQGRPFRLVDTGGWLARGSELDLKVSSQSERALKTADVILFVVDAIVGVTDEDMAAAKLLRAADTPVLLVANKIDDRSHESAIWDLNRLGLGDPFPVSSFHGRGVGDLLDAVIATFDADEDDEAAVDGDDGDEIAPDRIFSIALVGRPNVGKSTLFNRLIGEERSVVHDMPGTTRDTIDTVVDTEIGPVRFLDTAGMRRRSRINEDTEYYSVVRSLKAVDGADVALLIIDATEGVTQQDQRLAERVDAAGCPVVVVLNKMDQLTTDQKNDLGIQLERKLSFLPEAGVHRISALNGSGTQKLLPSLRSAIAAYQTRVPTGKVNDVIRLAQQAQPAPGGARVLYATQGAVDPPTFTLFANRRIPDHYLRYLERRLREEFDFGPTPIKIRVRRRSD
ncbi:MAG: ribosome biogenesis GTPase Der [Acidimicrobiia bacterium]|nr:ribosome biogenesis GTPase Der [Acidimicrobiia bacterium]